MCKSKAAGGQRCAAHTRPRFEAATFGTAEWDQAAAEYASTPAGELDIAERAIQATFGDDIEGSVAHFAALDRGRALRGINVETADEIHTQTLIAEHDRAIRECDKRSAEIATRHQMHAIPVEKWHERKMCIFDLETTGVDPNEARMVTASIVEVYGNPDNPDNIVIREWTVNPGVPIPPASEAVHGVSDAQAAARGLPPEYVARELNAFIAKEQENEVPIVAFNGTYDLTTLNAESARHGLSGEESLDPDAVLLVDPMVIDKAVNPYASGGRKLTAVAARVAGVEAFDAHNSSADCVATAKVAWALANAKPEIQVHPRRLMGWQRKWDERWADHMTSYVRSKGETERTFVPSFGRIRREDQLTPVASSSTSA